MSVVNILSAAIDAFKQNFTEMCQNLPNEFDTLDEKGFAMMTSALMNTCSCAGKAGLETFLKEHDSVKAKIEINDAVYRYKGTSCQFRRCKCVAERKREKKGRKNKRPGVSVTNDVSSTSYHNPMVGAVSLYGNDTQGRPERLSSVYNARMPEEKSVEFKVDFKRILIPSEVVNCLLAKQF